MGEALKTAYYLDTIIINCPFTHFTAITIADVLDLFIIKYLGNDMN